MGGEGRGGGNGLLVLPLDPELDRLWGSKGSAAEKEGPESGEEGVADIPGIPGTDDEDVCPRCALDVIGGTFVARRRGDRDPGGLGSLGISPLGFREWFREDESVGGGRRGRSGGEGLRSEANPLVPFIPAGKDGTLGSRGTS